MKAHPTRAYIDLAALRHNLEIVRKQIGPSRRVLAVVKANAYGLGAGRLAAYLQQMGVDMFGVAYTGEGTALRQAGITLPILVMAGALPDEMEGALEGDLTLALSDMDMARSLSAIASKRRRPAKVHIKVDTGMGRLGFSFDKALEAICTIASLPFVRVEGIFTHLSSAEEEDPSYTRYQAGRFRDIISALSPQSPISPLFHMGNSAAVMQYPDTYFDMVRVGIMLYGLAPVARLQERLPIRPVLGLRTKIIHITKAAKGSSLSYGRTYTCPSDRVIAVIPAGYSDGLARCMAGKVRVLIQGTDVPVVGTICMDMSIVDITGLDGVRIGDEAVLIGSQGERSITAHDWAQWQNTIPYEVLCAIGSRVARIYEGDGRDAAPTQAARRYMRSGDRREV